jgi:hypothetical protein
MGVPVCAGATFLFPYSWPPFLRDPLHRYLAVMRIAFDPDRFAVALRGGNKRVPAAHERIGHGITDKRKEFHAPQRQLDREGSGLLVLLF